MFEIARRLFCVAAVALLVAFATATPSAAADPIKIGFSMSLTGPGAPAGRQILLALEIWRDDVNTKGGLLGRPVALAYYDDQSNPATVPGIYAKLLSVDKADLLVGPYSTNMTAAAMPAIMQQKKLTISLLAIGVNDKFKYPNYFSMVPVGPEGVKAFSHGYFELAAAQAPKPKTVAIIAADSEFARTSADGARENAKALGFDIIYDKTYPPATTDFAPVIRAVQAANADVIFVAAYPLDTVGIVRAANEVGLVPKMFGGTMVGLLVTPIKVQLGPLMNGIVIMESFVPAPTFDFPGLHDLFKTYGERAKGQQVDPFGYGFTPFAYAAGQVLATAVTETKSLDNEVLAKYIHGHQFSTVAGEISFNEAGDWAKPRTVFTQFQDVQAGNLDQFRDTKKQPILWPKEYQTGTIIYPYSEAKK
jgi:branched-chain amino acid transport system substrate-binding protein